MKTISRERKAINQRNLLQPEALMFQLLTEGISGYLGLEYPCSKGFDCGSYPFSWEEINLKVTTVADVALIGK